MQVRYVGPVAELELEHDGKVYTFTRGEAVDVPDELAGRAPKGEPGHEKYDPGEGLLAQDFERVESRPTSASTKERDR